jgi:hypothetical protein
MAATNTLKFLPSIFQTDTNKKFLGATLDQLTAEADLQRVNGYIGRKFAPTYKTTDNYINEPTPDRQNYQLEPTVVVQNKQTGTVDLFSTYIDLIQQINVLGGNTKNHSRLFANESYTFDGLFDFDKFNNYNNYYWLPDGPDPVDVFAGTVAAEETFTVTRNLAANGYNFSGKGTGSNPVITLARGGTYKFNLSQLGNKFWIQSEPGLSGTRVTQSMVSTRNVFGVENNGASIGQLVFNVPKKNAQDVYSKMPQVASVDVATSLSYNTIQNQMLSVLLSRYPDVFDGVITDLSKKTLIFVNSYQDDLFWETPGIFDKFDEPFDYTYYDAGELVTAQDRQGVWTIELHPVEDGDYLVVLAPSQTVAPNQRIYIKSGIGYATAEFFLGTDGLYKLIPVNTSTLDRLYYQDGANEGLVGIIQLVDTAGYAIDVEEEIIGRTSYPSPNGVQFSNGLKIRFDDNVTPASYRNNEYYVEGVGSKIRLVKVDDLIVTETNIRKKAVSVSFVPGSGTIPVVTDGSFSLGTNYKIVSLGTTDWNYVAGTTNVTYSVGDTLVAKNVSSGGNGTAFNYKVLISGGNYSSQIELTILTAGINSLTSNYEVIVEISSSGEYTTIPTNPANIQVGTAQFNLSWQPIYPDYITINRDSIDSNAWSRSNRWFHIDIIKATAIYNNTIALPDQKLRAQRPIIEFEGHLQLFNSGRVAKKPIDLLVNNGHITDAMNQVEGAVIGNATSLTINNVTFVDGYRVIFADDFDPSVRNNIYLVKVIDMTGSYLGTADRVLHLELADDATIEYGNCVNVIQGENTGLNLWFDGTTWKKGQLKSGVNQNPLFDVIDASGNSLGDTTYYPVSSFTGTAIFSYGIGSGSNDKVLGFPLSYRNFNSIGDIQFVNNYDTESVTYASGTSTVGVPINYNFLRQNTSLTKYDNKNIWIKNTEKTKQYQIFSYSYTGQSNYFPIDITESAPNKVPYTKIFLNNNLLKSVDYEYAMVGAIPTIRITYSLLAIGDKVDILIYNSSTSSKTGYYEIPNSLDFNSKNANFTSLTLGQIRNHLKIIEQNTKLAVDAGVSFTGLRDIVYKNNGGSIVQQSSPALYSNIFLTDKTLNFVQSLDLASREYVRFKNKFLELSTKLNDIDFNNIPGTVDIILKSINIIKNKTFPWYYSDMIPYGDNRNIINYKVINPFQYQYEITEVFNDSALSSKSVLVYHNGVQLINGVDFSFPQDRSAIIINVSIPLAAGDSIVIYEYHNTDGSFVPETPSKLGLYPKFIPSRFVDDTYLTPIEVIQGHDGSITPVFGDVRDDLLLELEKRIYNNIKLDYETHIFDLYDHLPGKFRSTDYTLAEFNQILGNRFLRWVGDNRVDYSTNTYFESGNPWTWNYKKFKDRIDGSALPGTWRAIFGYFFDTYRPNTHPWEMLGFGKKPSWWEGRYGVAPYTGSNTLLWDDLEAGYIYAGNRQGIDTRFARPGLKKIIPVDDYGSLLSPEKWATSSFDSLKANSSYSVGDQGPTEFAWRNSSSFPYAIQYALALSTPGYYFGSLINVDRYYRDTTIDQLINKDTHQRITPATVVINGNTITDTPIRTAGYLNWIRDYVLSLGIDPVVKIQDYLNRVNIQLGYKVGGYTDKKFIQVLAEQGSPTNTTNSIIIPTENYSIQLNYSTPIRKAVYSAVTIQRTANGYTVNGYNQNNPYFTIIPSQVNSNYYVISSLKRRAIVYKDYQRTKLSVPYGYEFTTIQEIVDFLISYGRYLVAQGFTFTETDEQLGDTRNWVLSAKEFLNWSQQGWEPGSIIVLSPIFDSLTNTQTDGVVGEIENTPTGTKLLDQNSNFIKNTQFTEIRNNNTFNIKSINGQTICFADLNIVQYEHVVLFDNVTVFNDILYVPELGNRQFRLKLIGSKTASWAGAFSPPGFVFNNTHVDAWQPGVDYLLGSIVEYKTQYYTALSNIPGASTFVQDKQWRLLKSTDIKTGLLPNFAYNATRLQQIYDVDNLPADTTFEGYGTSLIGFRKRNYLSQFGLDETSQVKFYQGYIKEKGTLNAITGLTTAKTDNLTSKINIYEEWALRVGEYGSLTSDQVVELALDETIIMANPTAIEFLNNGDPDSVDGVVGFHPVDLYRVPADYNKNLFFERSTTTNTINDILTAGYVNLTDVNDTLFSFESYSQLDTVLSKIGPGYYIWVAKDYASDWNVYRITETQINITALTYNIDNLMTVSFSFPPNLAIGDVFAVKGFDTRFNGFYQVYALNGLTSVQVQIPISTTATTTNRATDIKDLKSISGYGVFYRLQSARLSDITRANSIIPLNGWEDGDKLWVDSTDNGSNWGVYNKVTAWNQSKKVSDEAVSKNAAFGSSIVSNKLANNFFIGSPSYVNSNGSIGVIKTFSRVSGGSITQTSKFDPRANTASNYGAALTASDYTLAVGASTSNSNEGYVYVHNLATTTLQVIRSNVAASGNFFGNAVALSSDNDWLYVGAPGTNSVFVYNFDDSVAPKSNTVTYTTQFTANLISGNASIVPVGSTLIDTNRIFNGTTITGSNIPAGTTVVSTDGGMVKLSNAPTATDVFTAITVTSNTIQLPYTPVSKYALQISDIYKNYIVDIDYTLSGNLISLVYPADGETKIAINQRPYYNNTGTVITPSDLSAGDRFGESVATTDDGRDLFIGAPGQNNSAGAVYAYKLFEESFNSNLDNLYTSIKNFSNLTKVYVDGIIQSTSSYTVVSNTKLSFTTALLLGQVVTIVSDQYVLAQKITEPGGAANNQFGAQLAIDHINSASLYVSAPNKLFDNGQVGAVYRFTDTGKVLGSALATNVPEYVKTLVTNGTTFDNNIGIYINGYFVDFSTAITTFTNNSTGLTVSGYADPAICASLINAAKIPMVSAVTTNDGFIQINSASLNANNKLKIRTNGSNFFSQTGISIYNLDQVITHPAGSTGAGFAGTIKFNPETNTLLVTSNADNVYYLTEIDTGKTTFDKSSTRMIDTVKRTGSVYLYELLQNSNTGITNTGLMSYVQHIKSNALKSNDQFGFAADINKDLILIGAPGDDSIVNNGGSVYAYENISFTPSWNMIRTQSAKVDIDNINTMFLYDKRTEIISTSIDYIDPAKGKILGVVEQDLDYKTAIDPAIYNVGTRPGSVFNSGYHWNERQVGKIWWKLDNLRYLDYEQDGLIYRSNNWGKLFPGSEVKVCEWVESKYPPSQYVTNGGDGDPLYTNAYSAVTTVQAGAITTMFYFWVTNKQNAAKNKRYSISVLSDFIANPQNQGIPYGFVMKNNAIGLVNVQQYLNNADIVLHVDFQKIVNKTSVHAEYELINENDPTSRIPARIIDKLIDSLSGIDAIGQVVPDPTLNAANRIGIDIRPRQTMVNNRAKAVENFVKYVNGVLIQYPIVYQYSLLGMEKVDPVPPNTEYDKVVSVVDDVGYIDTSELSVGYRVLVTSDSTNNGLWTIYRLDAKKIFQTYRIQYYNTALYWSKVDWYASDYDPTGRINFTVDAYKDIAALTLVTGNIVRVNYDDNAQFAIYRVNSDLTLSKVGIQNGTIQLNSTLYNLPSGQMGWDEDRFDTVRFDQTPSIEIRNILLALRDDIFINNLGDQFNKLFFVLVNYILQEQVNVDWIFKTSFINIFHQLRELSQSPSFVLDNQNYYLQYINEVKPYRTIVREYVVDYAGNDIVESNVTDFDLPSLYNKTLGKYRPPSGESSADTALINNTPEYQYWKKYHTFSVNSIELSKPGSGYPVQPAITITGGGGSGATATAALWAANGAIRSITVTNGGSGYTSAPTVKINGVGGGLAAARLINKTIRQFDSVLKFDRTAYDSNVKIWSSDGVYSVGDIVAYNGEAYTPTTTIAASPNFNFDAFRLLSGAEAGNANDRIITYLASRQHPNLDLTTALGQEVNRNLDNRFYLTQYINGIEYPGVKVQGLKFNANIGDTALLDTIIESRYVDTGLGHRPEDIVVDGGAYIDYYSSHAPEELLPGVVHESVDISVFTQEVVSQANTTVLQNGVTFAYREFLDINSGHNYYRISGFSTAYLTQPMDIMSTEIVVSNSTSLPVPDLVRAIPGELFIDGEKITYWENNTALNTLRNIRRGVGGTAIQPHDSGTTVYDVSSRQSIPALDPRTAIISSNSVFSSNTSINYWRANSSSSVFTTVDRPTYKLTLTGNITANVGDIISQSHTIANAVVRGNVVDSKTVAVMYNAGSFTTGNAICIISVAGTSIARYPIAVDKLGAVGTDGTVMLTSTGSNVYIQQDHLAWLDYDFKDQGLQFQDSGSLPARAFLGAGATSVAISLDDYYTTEGDEVSVNTILITENSQLIIKE